MASYAAIYRQRRRLQTTRNRSSVQLEQTTAHTYKINYDIMEILGNICRLWYNARGVMSRFIASDPKLPLTLHVISYSVLQLYLYLLTSIMFVMDGICRTYGNARFHNLFT